MKLEFRLARSNRNRTDGERCGSHPRLQQRTEAPHYKLQKKKWRWVECCSADAANGPFCKSRVRILRANRLTSVVLGYKRYAGGTGVRLVLPHCCHCEASALVLQTIALSGWDSPHALTDESLDFACGEAFLHRRIRRHKHRHIQKSTQAQTLTQTHETQTHATYIFWGSPGNSNIYNAVK